MLLLRCELLRCEGTLRFRFEEVEEEVSVSESEEKEEAGELSSLRSWMCSSSSGLCLGIAGLSCLD